METPLTLSLLFAPERDGDISVVEGGLPVTPLFGNRYRLEGSSAFGGGMLGDVIEVEPEPDGTHRFIRVVEPSGYRVSNWCLPREVVQSPEFDRFGEAIVEAGGVWERVMGGIVFVHLPPESAFDPEGGLRSVREAAAARREPDGGNSTSWWRRWLTGRTAPAPDHRTKGGGGHG